MIGSMMHLAEIDLRHGFGTVAEAMTRQVVSFSPTTTVADAFTTLERRGIRGAPVVDDERVVGIVTILDLAAARPRPAATGPFLRPGAHHREWTVADVMTRSPITATPREPLADAIERMDEASVARLPVVDEQGTPVGMLARADALHAVARALRGHRAHSLHRPMLLPD